MCVCACVYWQCYSSCYLYIHSNIKWSSKWTVYIVCIWILTTSWVGQKVELFIIIIFSCICLDIEQIMLENYSELLQTLLGSNSSLQWNVGWQFMTCAFVVYIPGLNWAQVGLTFSTIYTITDAYVSNFETYKLNDGVKWWKVHLLHAFHSYYLPKPFRSPGFNSKTLEKSFWLILEVGSSVS